MLREGKFCWRIDLDIFYRNAAQIIGFPDSDECSPYFGPALFIGGADSSYIDPDSIYALFPGANIITMQNAGHWVHAEQPEKFVDLVIRHCL